MGHPEYLLFIYGYVVMPDHVHLLLSEPKRETLAVAIQSLKQGVSRRLIGDLTHRDTTAMNGAPDVVQHPHPAPGRYHRVAEAGHPIRLDFTPALR